jgi:hypothetical protein
VQKIGWGVCPTPFIKSGILSEGGWGRAQYAGLERGLSSHTCFQSERAFWLAVIRRAVGVGAERFKSGVARDAASTAMIWSRSSGWKEILPGIQQIERVVVAWLDKM